MTKFSVMTGIDPAKPATDVIEYAKATERHGFDTLWLWDTWFSTDAFVTLTLAAANIERIGLANGVAATPVRHPSMLVNSIAGLHDVSNGRAILAVGCGGQATVGRLGMRKARIAELMTLEPDEIMFSSGFAHLDQVTKYAALVSKLKARA